MATGIFCRGIKALSWSQKTSMISVLPTQLICQQFNQKNNKGSCSKTESQPTTTKLVSIPKRCPLGCGSVVFTYLGDKRFLCRCGREFKHE